MTGEKDYEQRQHKTDKNFPHVSDGRKIDADKLREREKRDRRLEYERLRINQRTEKQKTLKDTDKDKDKKNSETDTQPNSQSRRRKSAEKECDKIVDKNNDKARKNEKGKSTETRPSTRSSVERQLRKSEDRFVQKENKYRENRDKRNSIEKEKVNKREESKNKEKIEKNAEEIKENSQLNSTMVQESRGSSVPPLASGTQENGSQNDCSKVEQERRERIQKYKDERRKQIAARYGNTEWSSEEENSIPSVNRDGNGETGGEKTSYKAYRRRRKHRDKDTPPNSMYMDSKRLSMENSNNNSCYDNDNDNNEMEGIEYSGHDVIHSISKNENGQQNSSNKAQVPPLSLGDSCDSNLSGSEGRNPSKRRIPSTPKDKSHKRKSHLNRSTTEEPVPLVGHIPSDSNEDTPRRRRRRAPPSPGNGVGPEPLKTPDVLRNVVSRLNSPTSSDPSTRPSSVAPPSPISSPRPTRLISSDLVCTKSAPTTLDVRSKRLFDQDDSKLNPLYKNEDPSESSDLNSRSASRVSKYSAKKKTDSLESTRSRTSVATSNVPKTPPSSRPSSVVLDKPPSGQDGARLGNFRNSLRKPQDTGTCFMASRREKRDETKPEFLLSPRQKKDRGSKSESWYGDNSSPTNINESQSVTNSSNSAASESDYASANTNYYRSNSPAQNDRRLDNSMGRIRTDNSPTERCADNMVHECEEYLSVNANQHEFIPVMRARDININETPAQPLDTASSRGTISDTGQKNWLGGSEGYGEESKRMAHEKEVKPNVVLRDKNRLASASAAPSGPPNRNGISFDDFEEFCASLEDKSGIFKTSGEGVKFSDLPERDGRRCSLDGGSPRARSPDTHSILKRRASRDREDPVIERSSTPEPQSILKRKSSSRTPSTDTLDSDPKPILKKKTSIEELDYFEPKPILKKKSSTDDELDDRPRSILKGGRSREDLDRADGVVSPAPILKRSPRCESESESDLRPILKRRDTTDGVRLRIQTSDGEEQEDAPSGRVRSDSAPDTGVLSRQHSPPNASATPSHSILKRRTAQSPGRLDQMDSELGAILRSRRTVAPDANDTERESRSRRPSSPSLLALQFRRDEQNGRPLSVAERVAGMEASASESFPSGSTSPTKRNRSPTPTRRSPGARPKVRPTSLDRSFGSSDSFRDWRTNRNISLGQRPPSPTQPADNDMPAEAINIPLVDAVSTASNQRSNSLPFEALNQALVNNFDQSPVVAPSSVSQKLAFFSQLEKAKTEEKRSPRSHLRKDRGARFATQPVTISEVSKAAQFAKSAESKSQENTSELNNLSMGSLFHSARESILKNEREVIGGLSPLGTPKGARRSGSRKTSLNDSEDERLSEYVRGILKRDGSRETLRDSPRSILKASSTDSRRASYSDSEPTHRGILKAESPLPIPMAGESRSPESDSRRLKGVLKKDSTVEDSKEIRSILKAKSLSLDREHSSPSTSSSDDVQLPASTPISPELNFVDAIDIDPIRQLKDDPPKGEPHRSDLSSADMAEALKRAAPIRAHDDLAAALRQIEPIHSKGKETGQDKEVEHVSKCELKLKIEDRNVLRSRTEKDDDPESPIALRTRNESESSGSTTSNSTNPSSPTSPEIVRLRQKRRDPAVRASYACGEMDAAKILEQSPLFRNKISDGTTSTPDGGTPTTPPQSISLSASSVSINERLAALQKSGEESWKQRIQKDDKDVNSNVKVRPKTGTARDRPTSLLQRMSMLETSSQQWKGRVQQSDAAQFTVAHRISSSSTTSVPAALAATPGRLPTDENGTAASPERKKKSPHAKVFKSKTGGNIPDLLRHSPGSSRKSFRRCLSQSFDSEVKHVTENGDTNGSTVSIPKVDDDSFDAFFSKKATATEKSTEESSLPELDLDFDFDHIAQMSTQLVVKKRDVKLTRRQQTTKNPLKSLAARQDIKNEYTEIKLGMGEKELRRMKVEELQKGSTMAVEALAGLASKENFSAVSLKKVEDNPVIREMPPYIHPMLLQVKGRRHAQTRAVETTASSVNMGDDFILVTASEVFHFKGEFTNVIERAKASEIAAYIVQTKDMGVNGDCRVVEVTENSPALRREKFWKILGGNKETKAQPTGSIDEDEFVESALTASNKVYEVQKDMLVPIQDSWGQIPKYSLLTSDKVLVFDFGSELYVWAGKRACGDERQVGIALTKEMWEEPYDYTDCDINPIYPLQPIKNTPVTGSRPDWTICAKLTENVETILFKEKFIDWPDTAQQTRIKEVRIEMEKQAAPVCELQPCDAKQMLENRPSEPDLVLEMSHLGRGVQYYDEEERRQLTISTNDSKIWHVLDSDKVLMDDVDFGHFYSGDSYVVRWYYHITLSGRTLKGSPSKHAVTGRDRVAYFFWQGDGSSVSEKGCAALMTVELDEERGPHKRVEMGAEPPAFLNLFKGKFVVHMGRQNGITPNVRWRMFSVRGELENEGHLIELEVDASHLRSRGCFLVLDIQKGVLHQWNGAKAMRHSRKVATTTAQNLLNSKSKEVRWKSTATPTLKEQYEGAETRDFWEAFGGSTSKKKYFSLLDDTKPYDTTARLWKLEATHNSFIATEISPSWRATEVPNALPFTQKDLYSVEQPGLFIIDGGHEVWVWQGWWPADDENTDESSAATTGSAILRFTFARRACLQTALNYCQEKAKANARSKAKALGKKESDVVVEEIKSKLVFAGLEPLQFTNLFHNWIPRYEVKLIQEKEQRWQDGCQYPVEEILKQLSRTQYSLAELQSDPLPDGVDPLRLEVYLNPEEFEKTLGMDRNTFYAQPNWKQKEIKKSAKLF